MSRFYSREEFEDQVQELMEQGRSRADAEALVREQERADELEYRQWLDRQDRWGREDY